MKDLTGKVVFVTGAAGGVGAALVRAFSAVGAHVAAADIALERIPKFDDLSTRIVAIGLDVTDPADWTKAIDEAEAALGPIAVLVNNAGLGQIAPVVSETPERWRRTFEVNAFGPFYGSREVLPRMLARGLPGHIVTVASQAGMEGSAGMAAYTASKHAAVGLSRSLRLELADTPIGVSVISPGMVRTGLVINSIDRISTYTGADALSEAARTAAANALELGMDPAKVAERIVRAVRDNEFYVFTHTSFAGVLRAQGAEMADAVGEGADPSYHEPDLSQFRSGATLK